jgi:hypothetical protein
MLNQDKAQLDRILSSDCIDWKLLSSEYKLSEDIIRDHANEVNWWWIACKQELSPEFMDQMSDKFTFDIWLNICKNQILPTWFIKKYKAYVSWDSICQDQYLTEEDIEKFSDKVYWNYISQYQKLSEKFILSHIDKFDMFTVIMYQKLSEEFIYKHLIGKKYLEKQIYLSSVIRHQKLSNEFIISNIHIFKPFAHLLIKYQKLSSECCKLLGISEYCGSWKDYTNDYKLNYILNFTGYEIIGDKVIAYKSTRRDGHSVYNFQYKYEVGMTYESHANYNAEEENSFGLSAWHTERALGYYGRGKLFRVEIALEDIACITINEKIRATKIKILEEVERI